MRLSRFIRQLHKQIVAGRLIQPGEGVVVAVSGGPDSMALLAGLAGMNQAVGLGLRLHVAHLNHKLRGPDADADAEFVSAQARRLGLAVTIESSDVAAAAGANGGAIEAVGRQARYDFFARVAVAHDCRCVATGHHADDNAETILHRIIRGTGPRGLAGIPARRPLAPDALLPNGAPVMLVRPLLGFRRRLILRVLAENDIPFRTDASNLSPDPTRNWLRHELIPEIAKRSNPAVVAALLRLGELSGWVNAFVEETASRVLASLVIERTDRALSLNAAALADKRQILQAEVIRQAFLAMGGAEMHLSLGHLKAVMRIAQGAEPGKEVHLPSQISARLDGDVLVIRHAGRTAAPQAVQAEQAEGLIVHWPGRTDLPHRRTVLTVSLVDNQPGLLEKFRATRTQMEELIDAERVHPPLVLRARRAGDRFWPLGAPGSKKVGDFLSDLKVPPMDRDRVCLLCDQFGPIWVMPYRIDDRVRVRERSGVLAHLRLEPMAAT